MDPRLAPIANLWVHEMSNRPHDRYEIAFMTNGTDEHVFYLTDEAAIMSLDAALRQTYNPPQGVPGCMICMLMLRDLLLMADDEDSMPDLSRCTGLPEQMLHRLYKCGTCCVRDALMRWALLSQETV